MSICDIWDLSVVLFLFLGVLLGFFSGAVTVLSYLLSPILGILSAKWLTPPILFLLRLQDSSLAEGVVAFFVFLFVSIICQKLINLLNHWVEFHNFYLLNSVFGVILGGCAGVMISFSIAWVLCYYDEIRPLVAFSRSAKHFTSLSTQLEGFATETTEDTSIEIPTNDIFFQRFVERLNPENLPPEEPLYGYLRVPAVETGETSDSVTISSEWTWMLGDEVQGNWVHRFLNGADSFLGEPSSL